MRYTIPILFIAATLLAGCHTPTPVHTQAAAPPPFQPMLISVFGTHPSPDGSWKIGVSEDAIHFARPASGETAFTPDSHGWRAKPGWFVFIESESRVWAYDGDHRLYLIPSHRTQEAFIMVCFEPQTLTPIFHVLCLLK